MWRRHAALALNGTAGVRISGKEPPSYAAQLPTPTGRSVQQGDILPKVGGSASEFCGLGDENRSETRLVPLISTPWTRGSILQEKMRNVAFFWFIIQSPSLRRKMHDR